MRNPLWRNSKSILTQKIMKKRRPISRRFWSHRIYLELWILILEICYLSCWQKSQSKGSRCQPSSLISGSRQILIKHLIQLEAEQKVSFNTRFKARAAVKRLNLFWQGPILPSNFHFLQKELKARMWKLILLRLTNTAHLKQSLIQTKKIDLF